MKAHNVNLNDLWRYDLLKQTWAEVKPIGASYGGLPEVKHTVDEWFKQRA
jgi:hypothetical protein